MILMTPGGKAGWSRGRAGPRLKGTVRSVKGEATFHILPQSKASIRQRKVQQLKEPTVRVEGLSLN